MRKALSGVAVLGSLALGGAVLLAQAKDAAWAKSELAKTTNHSMPIGKTYTMEQVLAMNHDTIMALWKTAPAASMEEMNGHFMGLVPNHGDDARQTSTSKSMFDQNNARNGYWLGKSFLQTGPNKGEGYNLWRRPGGKIFRNLRVATKVAPSLIDGKPSFHIDYSVYNAGNTLVDEMRKLDDYLFLGAATTQAADGKRTSPPAHFILTGPVYDWVPFPGTSTSTTP
jgi:hypothetical protein